MNGYEEVLDPEWDFDQEWQEYMKKQEEETRRSVEWEWYDTVMLEDVE